MKSRPIIFSAQMVRALLDGSKTQTRRILKPQPAPDATGRWTYVVSSTDKQQEDCMQYCVIDNAGSSFTDRGRERVVFSKRSPYGQPGDQLWVRETWQKAGGNTGYWYRATDSESDDGSSPVSVWRSSIHMPRSVSRITLEIISVRVERLHDISEADAMAEGVESEPGTAHWKNYENGPGWRYWESPKQSYRTLWESINGPGSWDLNPWVWVIEFKKVAA